MNGTKGIDHTGTLYSKFSQRGHNYPLGVNSGPSGVNVGQMGVIEGFIGIWKFQAKMWLRPNFSSSICYKVVPMCKMT